MSRQKDSPVCVGSRPRKAGSSGLEMSTKATPLFMPIRAYSLPVCASDQPQMSLPVVPPILSSATRLRSETPEHGNSPALPFVQFARPEPIGWTGGGGGETTGGGDVATGGGLSPPPPHPPATTAQTVTAATGIARLRFIRGPRVLSLK